MARFILLGAFWQGPVDREPSRSKWSVGVTAHHIAGVFERLANVVKTIAAGRALDGFSLDRIDEMNAQVSAEALSGRRESRIYRVTLSPHRAVRGQTRRGLPATRR